MTDSRSDSDRTNLLVPIGAALLVGVVAARCFVAISPEPIFDLDPLQDPFPWFGIGPSGILVSSVLMLLGAAVVLLGERLSGRGIDRVLLLLAMIPLIPITLHGAHDAGDLWRGMDWLAAVVGAVALAHAARTPGIRAAILGALLGAVALLAVRGALQMLVEHADTVAYFDAHRESVLRSFGWEPGSVQANLYERRLRQPEAGGWFGLANIFSALMAIGFVLLVGGLGRGRRALTSGPMLLLILLAIVLGVLLAVNGSKGALAAVLLGLMVAFAPMVIPSLRSRTSMLPGSLALIALGTAIGVVVLRGLLGESSLGGERSLLFRWHYLVGASRMLSAHPWLGVGPNGFQEAYLFFKPALSPEDPTSAHDAIVDWVATLGILGTAWIGLLAVLALRIGRGVAELDASQRDDSKSLGGMALFPIAILVAGGWGIWIELEALTPSLVVFRFVGLVLAVAIALAGRDVLLRMNQVAFAWCLGGAAATLLALGGIDMLFTQPGSVAIAWAFLGAFSYARETPRRSSDLGIAILPILVAVWLAIMGVYPQLAVGSQMERAAEGLRALGRVPLSLPEPPVGLAPQSRADALEAVRTATAESFSQLAPEHPLRLKSEKLAWDTLAPGSNDARVIGVDLMRRLGPDARRIAIDQLLESVGTYPRNLAPAWASVEQLRLQARMSNPTDASVALLEALVRTDDLATQHPGARAAITGAWVLAESADVESEPDHAAVVAAFENALRYSPHDPSLWVGLADAARADGDPERERIAIVRALSSDQARALDPLVQFSPEERAELGQRLARLIDQLPQ